MIKKVSLRKLYKLGLGKRGSPLFIKCYVENKGSHFEVKFYPNFLAKVLLIAITPIAILLEGVYNTKEVVGQTYKYVKMGKGKSCMSIDTFFSKNNSNIYKYLNSLFE